MDRFKNAVGPSELAMMQGVLDRYCSLRGVAVDSPEYNDLTSLLFAHFQRGERTVEALTRHLEAHFGRQTSDGSST